MIRPERRAISGVLLGELGRIPSEITDRAVLHNAANQYMSLEAEIGFCDPMKTSEVGGLLWRHQLCMCVSLP